MSNGQKLSMSDENLGFGVNRRPDRDKGRLVTDGKRGKSLVVELNFQASPHGDWERIAKSQLGTGALRWLEDALRIGCGVLCIKGKDVIHRPDHIGVLRGWGSWCWRLLDNRHGTHCTTEVDWEGRFIEGQEIRDLIRCVDDHTSLLNEWQPEDGVDRDVGSACDT